MIRYSAYILTLFTFILLTLSANSANAQEYARPGKYAAFVMHADTGLILHRENADKPLHPASLTKMMTLLMTFDALNRKQLRLNERIKISNHAASMIPSKIGLAPGSTIRVKDAIYALSTKSANDIAVALAERLGGTEQNFARMMTYKARQLGMKRTVFKNASGLHDKQQVSTARDMARLGRILVTQYSNHYHYFGTKSFTYQGKTYKSHNKLMNTYPGMDGLKTGYIRQSGFNLVSSAKRDGHRLIGVVFGGKNGSLRNDRMAEIMDAAFARLGTITSIDIAKAPIPSRKPVQHIQMAMVQKAQAEANKPLSSRWDMLDSSRENSMFNRMIGEGDYDIDVRKRLETGLIAISTIEKERIPDYVFAHNDNTAKAPAITKQPPAANSENNWSIQIGAFSDRDTANTTLSKTLASLPADLRYSHGRIAPLQTKNGWIFRSRLYGYSKEQAYKACTLIKDCIPVSPSQHAQYQ